MFEELIKAMENDSDNDESLIAKMKEEELANKLSQKFAKHILKFLIKNERSVLDPESMTRIIMKAIVKIHLESLSCKITSDDKLVLTKEDYETFCENVKTYEKMLFDNVTVVND